MALEQRLLLSRSLYGDRKEKMRTRRVILYSKSIFAPGLIRQRL